MKIIKKPENIDNWTFQFICFGCDCVLEVDIDDLEYISNQKDGDMFFVKCSVCFTKFIFPNKYIPRYVKIMVKKRTTASSYYDE